MHYTKFLLILTASSTGHSLRTDVQDKFYEMCETPKCEKDLYGHLQKSIPRNFKFSSSGCQSFNIPIDVPFPIHRCCDNMNVCFNSCGVRKESCDNDWRRCTEEMCLKETNEDLKLHCEITMGRIVDEILIPTKVSERSESVGRKTRNIYEPLLNRTFFVRRRTARSSTPPRSSPASASTRQSLTSTMRRFSLGFTTNMPPSRVTNWYFTPRLPTRSRNSAS